MKRPQLILSCIAIGAVCLMACAFGAYRELTRVEIGQSVPSVSWLPNTASRVFYYRSYPRTAYEFDIDEQGFVALAEVKGWKIRRFENGAFEIWNYVWCQNPTPPPNSLPGNASGSQVSAGQANLAVYEAATTKRITNGYSFEKTIHNGGTTRVGYDATAKRAYVFSTPR